MNQFCENVAVTVQESPLLRLNAIPKEFGVKCEVLAKCEFYNYGHCVESRFADDLLRKLEINGEINSETVINCNSNVALAVASRLRGHKCVSFVDESNAEMINLMRAIGVQTFGKDRQRSCEEFYNLNKVENEASLLESLRTIVTESLESCNYDVAMFVVHFDNDQFFQKTKEIIQDLYPFCDVIGFYCSDENNESMDHSLIRIGSEESSVVTSKLISREGILCGYKSGAAVATAMRAAGTLEENQRCVVLLPDGIFNYMHKLASNSRLFLENQKRNSEIIGWLWKIPVVNLFSNICRISVNTKTKCFEAIKIMKKHSLRQLAVLNTDTSFAGVITASDVTRKIIEANLDSSSPTEVCLRRNYASMSIDESVGKLLFLLENNLFVVVVDKVDVKSSRFIGILTQIDALNYICSSNSSGK